MLLINFLYVLNRCAIRLIRYLLVLPWLAWRIVLVSWCSLWAIPYSSPDQATVQSGIGHIVAILGYIIASTAVLVAAVQGTAAPSQPPFGYVRGFVYLYVANSIIGIFAMFILLQVRCERRGFLVAVQSFGDRLLGRRVENPPRAHDWPTAAFARCCIVLSTSLVAVTAFLALEGKAPGQTRVPPIILEAGVPQIEQWNDEEQSTKIVVPYQITPDSYPEGSEGRLALAVTLNDPIRNQWRIGGAEVLSVEGDSVRQITPDEQSPYHQYLYIPIRDMDAPCTFVLLLRPNIGTEPNPEAALRAITEDYAISVLNLPRTTGQDDSP